jgi:hypothetical protein
MVKKHLLQFVKFDVPSVTLAGQIAGMRSSGVPGLSIYLLALLHGERRPVVRRDAAARSQRQVHLTGLRQEGCRCQAGCRWQMDTDKEDRAAA